MNWNRIIIGDFLPVTLRINWASVGESDPKWMKEWQDFINNVSEIFPVGFLYDGWSKSAKGSYLVHFIVEGPSWPDLISKIDERVLGDWMITPDRGRILKFESLFGQTKKKYFIYWNRELGLFHRGGISSYGIQL